MPYVGLRYAGEVCVLTIDRPEALNALNSAVVAELTKALDEVAGSDARCLIVTGAGSKAFVAGADIAEMKDLTPEQAKQFSDEGNAAMERLETLPFPVIAAVNGYALGGGLEVALACDIRIASDRAVFALPETSLGILPGYGGVQRLSRCVGLAKAKELAFTAGRIDAQEALRIGLVNQVVPHDELPDAAMRMAEKIAANAPMGVRAVKTVANLSVGMSQSEATRLEREHFARCFSTKDQRGAMQAFVDKQPPVTFTGQ